MPGKHIKKEYLAGGYYHIYNRGVEKRDIFVDASDYKYFLYLLKSYLIPADQQKGLHPFQEISTINRGAFAGRIEILAYVLMPNHYHLLLKQKDDNDFSEFMRALMTNYVMYFNKKYDRQGSLFQGVCRAILVDSDDYLLHLSRYIHLNPVAKGLHPFEKGATLRRELAEQYSSYGDYLQTRNTKWINKNIILEYFENLGGDNLFKTKEYSQFVENLELDPKEYLGRYAID
jgi:putative transposase